MLAVAITGHKKSGKTALLSLIAEALEKRGKRVAVIKYSGHPIEKDNTDAYWLMRPGRTVVNVSPEETVLLWSAPLDFAAIARLLDADILLAEGDGVPETIPRILCFKEGCEEDAPRAAEGVPVLATQGECPLSADAPHFPEIDPMVAEELASLILEKGVRI